MNGLYVKKILIWVILIFMISCEANPDNLKYEDSLAKGLEVGRVTNKPIFLYFSGFGCMGDDEFNQGLVVSREIQRMLNEEFVTVILYCDDRREIREIDIMSLEGIVLSAKSKELLKYVKERGRINAIIEEELFTRNSQPLYVVLNSDKEVLVDAFGRVGRDKELFLEKLNQGLIAFRKGHEE